ncbi:hypothetical protein E4U17_002349 [Claviceps sp. LM77 group G4]|nr:hypothetical protein E4U17_002349 [Claviceps sp. LM77 group G4]
MACRGRCFWADEFTDNAHMVKHEQLAARGVVYKYHAFRVSDASYQPFCGECAVLYFYRSPNARWMRMFDISTAMSDQVRVMSEAGDENADLVQEMRNLRQVWGLE